MYTKIKKTKVQNYIFLNIQQLFIYRMIMFYEKYPLPPINNVYNLRYKANTCEISHREKINSYTLIYTKIHKIIPENIKITIKVKINSRKP